MLMNVPLAFMTDGRFLLAHTSEAITVRVQSGKVRPHLLDLELHGANSGRIRSQPIVLASQLVSREQDRVMLKYSLLLTFKSSIKHSTSDSLFH